MRDDFRRSVAERWHKINAWKWQADRPYKLIAFAVFPLLTVAILERLFAADDLQWFRDWVKGSAIYGPLFFPEAGTIEWKDRLQGVMLLLGLPVAFCLWHWRDTNVRDQIENARKDINLKEFQEVQLRAAGALDEKLPQEAREQLQIAALHQLRGFLRGDYGESFKRPAFELLLAGHAAAVHRIGVPEVQVQLEGKTHEQIRDTVTALRSKLSPIDRTRILIIRDEAEHIFRADYPLDGRRFDLLDLFGKSLSVGHDYAQSHFFGAILSDACLTEAFLPWAHFEGAYLIDANLEGAVLCGANLTSANIVRGNLSGVDLSDAQLENARLIRAHFEGADLSCAILNGADLRNAVFSEESKFTNTLFNAYTQFGVDFPILWNDLPESEKEAARAPWIARGMINVDAPPVTDSGSA